MEASQVIRDPSSRQLYLQELDIALGGAVGYRELDVLRPQLVELVTVCVKRTGGLRPLAECLDLLEPGSVQTIGLLQLADEWQVVEQFHGYDINWLRSDLSQLRVTRELHQFVAEIRAVPVPAHCTTAWHLFAHLASTSSVDGVPPWLRLLDRMITIVPDTSCARLQDLVVLLANEWGVTDQLDRMPTRPIGPAIYRGTAYLMIQFEKYGGGDDIYIVSHWYQWASPVWQPIRGEDQHIDHERLEAAVDQIIFETERRWADQAGPVTIEFVLPWQLLNEPVDTWRKELDSPMPSPLTAEYPLVVRSLERIRADQWHRLWRGRWRHITDRLAGRSPVYCAAVHQADVRLEAILKRADTVVVLVLSEPPTPGSIGERQVLAGLRSGVPAIIWHRGSPAKASLCQTVMAMIGDGISGSGLAELPDHVAKLRQLAWSEDPERRDQHIGHDFVILWDDPERQPGRADSVGGVMGKVRR